MHCGASVRELHGALVFRSTTFFHLQTSHITIVPFPDLPHLQYLPMNWREEMPGEEARARVSNVCQCSLSNVTGYVLILGLLVAEALQVKEEGSTS